MRVSTTATNAIYSEDPNFDHTAHPRLKTAPFPTTYKVDQDLFNRLANPKCPATPPLPLCCMLTKPKQVSADFFDRLYAEKLHKLCEHDDENNAHLLIGKGKPRPIDVATYNRLAMPKTVPRYEECQPLPAIGKKPQDLNALVDRLSKPRYYIVWKKKKEETIEN
ncbi:hypothetical protein HDU98_001142 [Podochytrium sp. JEL0797]|nr:hypothetical protein HDU98_001142 [Podochytrium sp. JEL0797]